MFRTALLAAGALVLSACAANETTAANASPEGRDCFRANDVNGYGVIDDHNIRVTVSANRRYILSTNWNVNQLDWTNALAVRSPSGWICTGSSPGLEVIGGRPPQNYPIQSVSREPTPPEPTGS